MSEPSPEMLRRAELIWDDYNNDLIANGEDLIGAIAAAVADAYQQGREDAAIEHDRLRSALIDVALSAKQARYIVGPAQETLTYIHDVAAAAIRSAP